MAKPFVSEAAEKICSMANQALGDDGYTKDLAGAADLSGRAHHQDL